MSVRTQGMVGQLKRLLTKPPKGAVEVRLMTGGSSALVLERHVTPFGAELAEELCATVDEHASQFPGTTFFAQLLDEERNVVVTRPIIPSGEKTSSADDDPAGLGFVNRGDPMAQAQNSQRHLEVIMRQMASERALNMQALRDTISGLTAQITDQRKYESEQRARADALQREMEKVIEEAQAETPPSHDGEDGGASAYQERVLQVLLPLVPAIAGKLLAAPTTPPVPPVKPG